MRDKNRFQSAPVSAFICQTSATLPNFMVEVVILLIPVDNCIVLDNLPTAICNRLKRLYKKTKAWSLWNANNNF